VKIGVFDSGLGGLTVLRELEKHLPNHEYIYFGDFLRVPYGDKPRNTIINYAKEIVEFLLSQGVHMIVVACNTVVASAMTELRAMCPVPIIGVVEPTTAYLETSGYKNVGIAATTATISSGIYSALLATHGISSVGVACPELVPLIESNNFGQDLDNAIEKYFGQFLGKDIEAIVLGCTHFPLIRDRIQNYLNSKNQTIELIDPAVHTVNHIKAILVKKKETIFWFGKIDETITNLASSILGRQIKPKLWRN